jgi:serine/threonine protein kinase
MQVGDGAHLPLHCPDVTSCDAVSQPPAELHQLAATICCNLLALAACRLRQTNKSTSSQPAARCGALSGAPAVPPAAPEILLNQKISEKADVYSFGVMLWEIVTGIAPVRGGLSDVSVPEDCPAEISDLIKVRACLSNGLAQMLACLHNVLLCPFRLDHVALSMLDVCTPGVISLPNCLDTLRPPLTSADALMNWIQACLSVDADLRPTAKRCFQIIRASNAGEDAAELQPTFSPSHLSACGSSASLSALTIDRCHTSRHTHCRGLVLRMWVATPTSTCPTASHL